MRILPKGTLGVLTGRRLPEHDPQFRPPGILGRTLTKIGKVTCWPTAKSHILCGATGAGKSTMIYQGLHELSEAGVYAKNDVSHLGLPIENTEDPSRFTIEREGLLEGIDSWIDIKGEDFSQAFALGGKAAQVQPELEAFLKQVNVIVMVMPAQALLDIYRRRESPNAQDVKLIQGFTQRINDLHPSVLKIIKRVGFRWYFIVNQCAHVKLAKDENYKKLISAIRHFSDKTGFKKACKYAILCDSKPDVASELGNKISVLDPGGKRRLNVTLQGEAEICSAGVALGIILGRLRPKVDEHKFIIALNEH